MGDLSEEFGGFLDSVVQFGNENYGTPAEEFASILTTLQEKNPAHYYTQANKTELGSLKMGDFFRTATGGTRNQLVIDAVNVYSGQESNEESPLNIYGSLISGLCNIQQYLEQLDKNQDPEIKKILSEAIKSFYGEIKQKFALIQASNIREEDKKIFEEKQKEFEKFGIVLGIAPLLPVRVNTPQRSLPFTPLRKKPPIKKVAEGKKEEQKAEEKGSRNK